MALPFQTAITAPMALPALLHARSRFEGTRVGSQFCRHSTVKLSKAPMHSAASAAGQRPGSRRRLSASRKPSGT